MATSERFAIITPYYKEPRATLERCMASVARQTRAADHFLVADGHPQDWIGGAGVRHIRLDRAHGDYGNVARGLGALTAAGEAYAGIGFLDADNYLDTEHVAACVQASRGADLVIARRRFVRPDGRAIEGLLDEGESHVDTNCYWFAPGSYHLIAYWVTMPNEVAAIGDRLFHSVVLERKIKTATVPMPTVNYTAMWQGLYEKLGETPPPGAKPINDPAPAYAWLKALPENKRQSVGRLIGLAAQ